MFPINDTKFGIKFDNDNPPPGFRGHEIESMRLALARLRTVLISRIPTRGISAVSILVNQSVHTPGDLMMRLSSLIPLRRVKEDKIIINVRAPSDEPIMVTTSDAVDIDGNGDIFPPLIPIAILNNNQVFHVELHVTIGDTHTFSSGFSPVTVCNFYQTSDGGYQFEFELSTGITQSKEIYNLAAEISRSISKQ